jgi:hypothetical protein
LHATALTSHDGAVIAGDRITFAPAAVDTTALHDTHEVAVTVRVPRGTKRGVYHGYVLADGLPEIALPVRVTVGLRVPPRRSV